MAIVPQSVSRQALRISYPTVLCQFAIRWANSPVGITTLGQQLLEHPERARIGQMPSAGKSIEALPAEVIERAAFHFFIRQVGVELLVHDDLE